MNLDLTLFIVIAVLVLAGVAIAGRYKLTIPRELSVGVQAEMTILAIVLYATAWLTGAALHAPVFLQQLVALGVGSLVGVTLYRLRKERVTTQEEAAAVKSRKAWLQMEPLW